MIVVISIIIFRNIQNSVIRVPKIAISEEEWDFGKVEPAIQPQHKFNITNKGTEKLIVERVWTSCGCLLTSISTKRILPGKSVKLEAIFHTEGYEGKLEKIIYIKSNDPEVPEKRIKVKVEIGHQFNPKVNIFGIEQNIGVISQGNIVNLSLTIENQGDAELVIDKIETYEHIQYNNTLPFKILPKEKFELILIYDSTNHELGNVKEAVQIYCNDPTMKSFVIKVSGYVTEKETDKISISPTEAVFNLAPDSKTSAIEKFFLKNLGDEDLKIISIESSVDYLIPLRSELSLKSKEEQDLQVVLLKDKAREEVKGDRAEEYLYLTIAIPIEINK